MNIELILNLANLLFLTGTVFLIRTVLKNRNALSDFNLLGSMLTFSGMLLSTLAWIGLQYYSTVIISAPTTLFWAVASLYSFKNGKAKKQ